MSITKRQKRSEFTFSTETDIYITAQSEVIVADLPAELQAALEAIGPRISVDAKDKEQEAKRKTQEAKGKEGSITWLSDGLGAD